MRVTRTLFASTFIAIATVCADPAELGSYSLAGRTIGPAYAPDPFHVDWERFCRARSANCDRAGNPHYAGDDASMIANTFPTSFYGQGVAFFCAGARVVALDMKCPNQVGVYVATDDDPLVTIHVALGNGYAGYGPDGHSGSLDGASIRIPYGAIAQTPEDGHLDVRQPNGVICQLWQTRYGMHTASRITERVLAIGGGGCFTSDLMREGDPRYAPASGYASSDEISRGLIRAEDVVGANGDGTDSAYPMSFSHALYGGFSSNRSGYVWPAAGSDGSCALTQNGGAMPMEGMYFYLDRAGYAAVEAWNAPIQLRPLKRFLGTLHKFGMLDLDSSDQAPCTSDPAKFYINELTWGPQATFQKIGTSPFDVYLRKYIEPHDASYAPNGNEQAIYVSEPGSVYTFAMLHYSDVPGLAIANFHWLGRGCGELAVKGTTGANAC